MTWTLKTFHGLRLWVIVVQPARDAAAAVHDAAILAMRLMVVLVDQPM
jgi:hypothetical protein